jgi:hypothetical protein
MKFIKYAPLVFLVGQNAMSNECIHVYNQQNKKTFSVPAPTSFAEYKLRTLERTDLANQALHDLMVKILGPQKVIKPVTIENLDGMPGLIRKALEYFPENQLTPEIINIKNIADQVSQNGFISTTTAKEFTEAFWKGKGSFRALTTLATYYAKNYTRIISIGRDHYLSKSIQEAKELGLLTQKDLIEFIALIPESNKPHDNLPEAAASKIRNSIVQLEVIKIIKNRDGAVLRKASQKQVDEIIKNKRVPREVFESIFSEPPIFEPEYGHIMGNKIGSKPSVFPTKEFLLLPEFNEYLKTKSEFTSAQRHHLTLMLNSSFQNSAIHTLTPNYKEMSFFQIPVVLDSLRHIIVTSLKEPSSLNTYFFTGEYRENSWDGGQMRSSSSNLLSELMLTISTPHKMAIENGNELISETYWMSQFRNESLAVQRFVKHSLQARTNEDFKAFYPEALNSEGKFNGTQYTQSKLNFLEVNSGKGKAEIAEIYDGLRDYLFGQSLALELTQTAVFFNKSPMQLKNHYNSAQQTLLKMNIRSKLTALDILELHYATGRSFSQIAETFVSTWKNSPYSHIDYLEKIAILSLRSGKDIKAIDVWIKGIENQIEKAMPQYNTSRFPYEILETAMISSQINGKSLQSEVKKVTAHMIEVAMSMTGHRLSGFGKILLMRYSYLLNKDFNSLTTFTSSSSTWHQQREITERSLTSSNPRIIHHLFLQETMFN